MSERKTLSEVLKDIKKEYGTDVMIDRENLTKIESVSTGCYSLDYIFGCGGLPCGRILDLFGEPSSGKSTLAMFLCSVMQKQGRKVAWIDAEYAWSEEYAEKVGINTKDLLLFQPESAEQGIDILQKLTESGEVSLICVDSTAALVPEAELDGEIRDAQVALQARILSKGLRMVTGTASRNKTTILFISQMRSKIGFTGYGEKSTTSGGRALAFYSSVRLEVARISSFKGKKDEVVGNRLRVTAKKNKVGLPFRSAEIDLKFGSGIDIYTDIFDVAVNNGIIAKDGLSFSYAKNKLSVGREASVNFLRSNVDIYNSIKEQVMLIGKDKDEKEIKQIKNKK